MCGVTRFQAAGARGCFRSVPRRVSESRRLPLRAYSFSAILLATGTVREQIAAGILVFFVPGPAEETDIPQNQAGGGRVFSRVATRLQ